MQLRKLSPLSVPMVPAAPSTGWVPPPRPHPPPWLSRFTAWYGELRAWPRRLRRGLQRRLALPLTGVALLLALSQAPSLAATIVVDGTTCTLVDAITAANTDTAQGGCPAGSGADTLVLEPPGRTITLTDVDNATYGPTGLPVIRSPITIVGQGGTITRAPNVQPFRLLAVNGSGDLTLQDVTLTAGVPSEGLGTRGGGVYNYNGAVTLIQSTIAGNSGGGVVNISYGNPAEVTIIQSLITGNIGPGVFNWFDNYIPGGSAIVTLTQSTISGNIDRGILNLAGAITLMNTTISDNTTIADGGGVLNLFGSVVFIQSTILRNMAGESGPFHGGGGVLNWLGSVTLTQSTISGNTTSGRGGGVCNLKGSVTLTQSTISGNTAGVGGGVVNEGSAYYNYYGRYRGYSRFALTQATIEGNAATNLGGGVVNQAHSYSDATLRLTNSTISGNRAPAGGGVVNAADGGDSVATATLTHSTITGNTATNGGGGMVNAAADDVSDTTATLSLAGSLVTGNLAPTAPEILQTETGGTISANAFNLFGVNGDAGVTGFTPGPIDLVPSAPLTALLEPVLADHGGPTLTHALVPGSPAIDVIPPGTQGCGTTVVGDQRWQARPQPAGGACDIGAYEVVVAGQPLGAWVSGLVPDTVMCTNLTTGQAVTLSEPASAWDCEAAGLGVSAGDHVAMGVRGTVETGATDVGGAVTGLEPRSARCTNLTTGDQVQFQRMRGATAGSCVAAGLVVQSGDRLQLRVQGEVE